MRIVCPSCSAAYEVPDALVTPSRRVRCARCGEEWTPTPVEISEPPIVRAGTQAPPSAEAPTPLRTPAATGLVPTEAQSPQFSAMDRLAQNPARPPSALKLRLAWAASAALLIILAWGAYTWRAQIMQAWPPSTRLYAAFGLHAGPDHAP